MDSAAVVVVGAGAAGLALACRLGEQGAGGVVLVEAPPGPQRSPERTWCSWGSDAYWVDAVSARWDRVSVHAPGGSARTYDLAPLDYTMIRSRDYERVAAARLARTSVRRVEALVTGVEDGPSQAVVHGPDLRAGWVFDTRPAAPAHPGRVALLQHFRGWFVRTRQDAFDPTVAGLMDFRPPQPPGGVAFGYLLPTSPREALVEYTEFSRSPLTTAQYDAALADYTLLLGLPAYDVVGAEQGAIPMTDAPFPRRLGQRVFRLGAAGGATRPATGYTFTAAQRQARAVAEALRDGRDPCPPAAYTRRHRWMDALLLRALDDGAIDGATFLAELFARHPTERVLRFLDGKTSPREDLAVMASAPKAAMIRTAMGGVGAAVQHLEVTHDFALPLERVAAYLSEPEHLEALFGGPVSVTRAVPNELVEYHETKGGPLGRHRGALRLARKGSGATLSCEIEFEAKAPLLGRAGTLALEGKLRKGLRMVDLRA
ncbi:MAG: lycopene cyclase family protein [Mycobacteriales bacterium]